MAVKTLGSGCVNCEYLETNTRRELAEMGIEVEIDHVVDEAEIVNLGC